jgi:hypothetical protein
MEIVNLSERSENAAHRSPEQLLKDALSYIEEGRFEGFKKMLILTVDEQDEQYRVYWMQAGMKNSECVALCETGKMKFFEEMNYVLPND